MNDDTPTQRLPESGTTPTEQFPVAAPADPPDDAPRRSLGPTILLVVAGLLLIVAIIALVVFVGTGGGPAATGATPQPTSSSEPAPSVTPIPTETTAAEPPQPTGAQFTSFDPVTEVRCAHGGPGFAPEPPVIEISWATIRASSAWIVQGTSDAADSGFMQIPLSGDQSGFPYPLQFPCFQDDTVFTITLVGDDGLHVSSTWTVTNIGERE